ncbi:hypothetical protein HYV22_02460 [Candidatus Gottesmanbacteria bacterium]|nr:hypothetical protein [Candidatus Gottesmanbacteria bacterium]
MQKRFVFIAVLGIVALAAGTGLLIFSKKTVIQPPTSIETAPMPTPAVKLLTWDDPAGFTFSYPEGLTVNKHDEDQENYAHVELTNTDHPGSLIVWAKDTLAADVVAWVRTEKQFAGATILDTTLGNQPAKKIVFPPNKLIIGTIYDELLFTIDAMLEDKTYWTQVQDAVVNSFAFKQVQDASGVSSEGAIDEEEVLQ